MKFRIPRRALLAFVAASALLVAVPAMASAAQTFTLGAASLGAGSDPNLTSATGLDAAAGTPATLTLVLAPGLLANETANTSCLTSIQTTSTTPGTGCDIGSGTITTTLPSPANSVPYNAYIVPPTKASDLAGVELVATGAPVATGSIDLRTTPTVGLNVSVDLSTLGGTIQPALTGIALNVNGTLNGQPFTRLPATCVADTSSVMVTYGTPATTETTANSTPFTPTACSSLAFSPKLMATVTKDTADSNVAVTTAITQAAGEAPDKTLSLTVPASLSPNVASATAVFNKGTSVGSATATSPLLPSTLTGTVTLTGTSLLSPDLTLTFPAPFPLVLQGVINLTNNSVTFSSVPDVPLSSLGVSLTGGAQGLYEIASCTPSTVTLSANFTGQNGATATSNSVVPIAGCSSTVTPPPPGGGTVGAPTASGSALGGLVKNKAKLGFTVSEGTNAKPIKTIAVSLPKGISFSSKAKNLKNGIAVKGAGKFTYKVSKGVLTITLATPAAKATVTLKSPAVSVSSKLAKSVKKELKKKKVAALNVKVKVTDSGGTATTLKLPLKPRS